MTERTIIIEEDKYKVEIDEYNHTLYTYRAGGHVTRNPKTGEESIAKPKWVLKGYYPNMRQVLSACVELDLMKREDTNLSTYLLELKSLLEGVDGRISK